MQVNWKKLGFVTLVVAVLLNTYATLHYFAFRAESSRFFEISVFDVNDRMQEIEARYLAKIQDAAQKVAKDSGATTTTLPKK